VANKFIIKIIGENTIKLSISSDKVVQIEGIIYAPEYDFNLIFLNQLKKTGITYHDNENHITLKKNGTIIAKALAVKNMFLLNIIISTTLVTREKPNIFRGTTE